MWKGIAVLVVVAAVCAAFPAAGSSSARFVFQCKVTPESNHVLQVVHSPLVPPTQATTTSFTGDKGTSCTRGALSEEEFQHVSKADETKSVPQSLKKTVKGPCTDNFEYPGSNTTIVTNAKTGKSTQKTQETAVFFCDEKGTVLEVITTLPAASLFPQVELAEEALVASQVK